ncbi:MAG: hypothetical protein JXA93_04245 [Anaerolineae bacterium]|nr:hypothetical protein [Anaerolineae bacterium]
MREFYELSHRLGLATPVRNHYFYGQLLGVQNFEVETEYFNRKRWLINRLILGYGVVCGLDVKPGPKRDTIVITPGVALDGLGREIIVPEETRPVSLLGEGWRHKPQQHGVNRASSKLEQQSGPEQHYMEELPCEEFDVYVVVCYHECESDPVPIRAGDCATVDPCAPGSIREQYRIEIKDGLVKPPNYSACHTPDFISGNHLDYDALAKSVTKRSCQRVPRDPCIPLANIHVVVEPEGDRCHPDEIDITVRPIVYSNDLLCRIIQSLLVEPRHYHRGQ